MLFNPPPQKKSLLGGLEVESGQFKVSQVTQGPDVLPAGFLQRLCETSCIFTP